MNITEHDFAKPAPLPALWEERLGNWAKLACAQATKAWAKELPIALETSVRELTLQYAEQAFAELSDASLAYRVKIAEGRVVTLLTMPLRLMLNLVGVLLGDTAPADHDRDLTLIEENLGDYFLASHWLAAFRETWPGAQAAGWVLDGREANPRCSRCFAPTDVLVALHWEIAGPWGKSGGVWLMPKQELLKALGEQESAGAAPVNEVVAAARRQGIVQALPLLVQVILGTTEVSLAQLAQVQVGDLLVLDQHGADAAIIRIGNRELFRGTIGRQGTSKAMQIQALIEK